ncbi:predicted protein [Sclerotinia sclerotiorum 1980 UF-70]|uniref:Uncharacterized protein n=2 Tax=Sclerotinia sclerotiorum (strain ATCC 18683 / 1980 / Ss-1) TaxID=665079 RepID=A7EHB9_SCLS1|nr:predicted protein [Sclerotinia sclerotiorum 1980 UF-70]APA06701.1 hypothetical protein sscle_02g014710 [Sclerotinia sclerotiorum 1980 UF-70]EDO02235.1 predicted protein [Sclerotinia sclerotiorum 1980 UF-70]
MTYTIQGCYHQSATQCHPPLCPNYRLETYTDDYRLPCFECRTAQAARAAQEAQDAQAAQEAQDAYAAYVAWYTATYGQP